MKISKMVPAVTSSAVALLGALGFQSLHFFVSARTVHEGKNGGSGNARVLVTYIVEKGKPLATPAK